MKDAGGLAEVGKCRECEIAGRFDESLDLGCLHDSSILASNSLLGASADHISITSDG